MPLRMRSLAVLAFAPEIASQARGNFTKCKDQRAADLEREDVESRTG